MKSDQAAKDAAAAKARPRPARRNAPGNRGMQCSGGQGRAVGSPGSCLGETGRGQRKEVRSDLHEIHEEVVQRPTGHTTPGGANRKAAPVFCRHRLFSSSCRFPNFLPSSLLTSCFSRPDLHGRPRGNEYPDLLDLAVCQGDAAVGPVEEVLDVAHPEFILFHAVDHDAPARRHPQGSGPFDIVGVRVREVQGPVVGAVVDLVIDVIEPFGRLLSPC